MRPINLALFNMTLTRCCSFQNSNNGKGGTGGDPVLISVQDGSGTDNANFATPPDGQ